MLAWLLSLYLVLHRDIFAITPFLHRSLSATAHIIMPLVVIGGLSIFSLIKMPRSYKSFLRYGVAILIVVFTLMFNLPGVFSTLDNAYDSPFLRLTPVQIEVSEWLRENVPENVNVTIIGPPNELSKKVYWMASYSHRTSSDFQGFLDWPNYEENREEIVRSHILNDYVVFDYSDIALLSDRSFVERWLAYERQNFANLSIVYNKDNIRVYYNEPS